MCVCVSAVSGATTQYKYIYRVYFNGEFLIRNGSLMEFALPRYYTRVIVAAAAAGHLYTCICVYNIKLLQIELCTVTSPEKTASATYSRRSLPVIYMKVLNVATSRTINSEFALIKI